jgi:hypothetical protein
MKRKSLVELQKLRADLAKDLAVLKRAIDALKAARRKPKRSKKKWFTVLPEIRGSPPAFLRPASRRPIG